jgi:branched-chain amino acid transport system substrate-binding protein
VSNSETDDGVHREQISEANQRLSAGQIVFGVEPPSGIFSMDEENIGFIVAFREANDNSGVDGRLLGWTDQSRKDSNMDTAHRFARAKMMAEEDHVFALVNMGGMLAEPLADYAEKNCIPYLFPHTGLIEGVERRYLFTSFPLLANEARVMFEGVLKQQQLRRVGLAYANDEYGSLYHDALVASQQTGGYNVIGLAEVTEWKPESLVNQFEALAALNVDSIVMALYPEQARALIDAKAVSDWHGRLIASGPLTDEELLVREDGAAEGTLGFCHYPDPEYSQEPGLVQYRTAMAQYAPDRPLTRYSVYGYVFGCLIVDALRRAGPDPTPDSLVDSLEATQNWSSGGIMPEVSFDREDHHAQEAGFVCILERNRFHATTGWISNAEELREPTAGSD